MNDIKFYGGSLFGFDEYHNHFIGTRKSNKPFVNYLTYRYTNPELPDILKRIRSSDGIPTYADSGDIKTIKYTNYYE